MSETILWISRSSAQSNFLKDFYGFSTILDTGNLETLYDYDSWSFDVWILRGLDNESWVLIWVVDADTLMLSRTWSVDTYHNSLLWYRSLSSSEIFSIDTDASVIYDYKFFWDKLFTRFNLQDFQMISYNSWSTVEMVLSISSSYNPALNWESWLNLPRDEIFKYSLVF
jgi:hypothetical protein